MVCSFGVDQSQPPCADAACAVCTIAQRGFSLAHAGTGLSGGAARGGWLRYGKGMYFSKVSSKSNDYAGGTHHQRGHTGGVRCMFLCKVAVGAPHETYEETLSQRDVEAAVGRGYNSVVGLDRADGGALNYEETVLYDEHAAIPSYLIVYELR